MVAYCRFAHSPKLRIQRNSAAKLRLSIQNPGAERTEGAAWPISHWPYLFLPIALWESQLLTNDWGQWIFPAQLDSNVHSIKENKNLGKFGCFEPPGNPSCYVFLTKRWQGLLGTELLLEGGGKIITPFFFSLQPLICAISDSRMGGCMWKY